MRKGVVLAGGSGTRLRPYTWAINKHLLPVLDQPMVCYPLATLKGLGIQEICVVTGVEHLDSFRKVIGDGSTLSVSITYRGQAGPKGIADALSQSESFFGGQKVVAILGDVIFRPVTLPAEALTDDRAYVFVSPTVNPGAGVPEFGKDGRLLRIEEKPTVPKSNLMVVGLYVYPPDVFEVARKLKPSKRGEMEITDVNNWYIDQGRASVVRTDAYVIDAGTLETLEKAAVWRAREKGLIPSEGRA